MNKILLMTLSLLISTLSLAENPMKKEVTDTFSDQIKKYKENENEIIVTFFRHSAIYKIKKTNPKFSELKILIEKLKKDEKKINIIAIIPQMEIKEIKE